MLRCYNHRVVLIGHAATSSRPRPPPPPCSCVPSYPAVRPAADSGGSFCLGESSCDGSRRGTLEVGEERGENSNRLEPRHSEEEERGSKKTEGEMTIHVGVASVTERSKAETLNQINPSDEESEGGVSPATANRKPRRVAGVGRGEKYKRPRRQRVGS